MKRTLTLGTIIVLSIMVLTTSTASTLGFTLMMSSGIEHNIARIVLISALLIVAFTTRPRSKHIRMLLAAISAVITTYALTQTANYGLQIFDSLAYLLSAVILMTESLEVEPKTIKLSSTEAKLQTN